MAETIRIVCAVITIIALVMAAVWNIQAFISLRKAQRGLKELRETHRPH